MKFEYDDDFKIKPPSYTISQLLERLPTVGHGLGLDGWEALRTFLKDECACPMCDKRRVAIND